MIEEPKVKCDPPPAWSEPITDEEGGAMFRAALNLFRGWDLTDDQAAVLLDLPKSTYSQWKYGDIEGMSRDCKIRLSNLMGIHKALRSAFLDASLGCDWMKAPNGAFQGLSALNVMLQGHLTGLMRVRRYLGAAHGG